MPQCTQQPSLHQLLPGKDKVKQSKAEDSVFLTIHLICTQDFQPGTSDVYGSFVQGLVL